jgi:hypothetical protein
LLLFLLLGYSLGAELEALAEFLAEVFDGGDDVRCPAYGLVNGIECGIRGRSGVLAESGAGPGNAVFLSRCGGTSCGTVGRRRRACGADGGNCISDA